jgi:hypothetical protein
MPKYPHITVQLTGTSNHAIAIMMTVATALRRGGVPSAEIERFKEEALSGDYDHVLATAMAWVEVR